MGNALRYRENAFPRGRSSPEWFSMLKILLLTGDAGEAQEIYYAKYRLEEEGWEVRIAALKKRAFLSVVHDFVPGFDTYTEKPGYRVEADLGLDEVKPEQYDGLVLPDRTRLARQWPLDAGICPLAQEDIPASHRGEPYGNGLTQCIGAQVRSKIDPAGAS